MGQKRDKTKKRTSRFNFNRRNLQKFKKGGFPETSGLSHLFYRNDNKAAERSRKRLYYKLQYSRSLIFPL